MPSKQTPNEEQDTNTLILEDPSLYHGFVQLPKLVLYGRNISCDAKLLYAILLGYAWQEKRCFPGYDRLCQDMDAGENTVRVTTSTMLDLQRREVVADQIGKL